MVGQAGSEIERKFVPDPTPSTDGWAPPVALRQGYLAEEGDVTVRVRFAGSQARLTVKAGAGCIASSWSSRSIAFVADRLWPSTAGRRVTKRRYRVPLGDDHPGLVAEVDFYEGALDGLCTVEVEFDSVAAGRGVRAAGVVRARGHRRGGLDERRRCRATVPRRPACDVHARPPQSSTPMSSFHSVGLAAMKSVIIATHSASSSTTTSTPRGAAGPRRRRTCGSRRSTTRGIL